ncbi:MAG: CHAT domain-containing protein [Pseudomonadota bacterium]|nr:CHAT domain-containing protein [Pseudomonadota bacterium]
MVPAWMRPGWMPPASPRPTPMRPTPTRPTPMRRRDFLTCLAGLGAIAALPIPALAGAVEDGQGAFARGDLGAAVTAWEGALPATTDPTARVELLLRLAAAYRQQGRVDLAGQKLDEAEKTGLLAARVANDRGLWLLAVGDAPAAADKLKAAFDAARGANDPHLAANAASNLGLARMALGRPDEAGKAFEAARALFLSLGDDLGRADALTNAGLAHRRAGRLRDARAALEEAVGLFQAQNERLGSVDASNDLGIVLQSLGLDDLAGPLYERALADATGDVRRAAALTANLATVYHRKGDLNRAKELYSRAEAALTQAGRPDDAVAIALQRALLGAPDVAEYRKLYAAARDPRIRATAALNLAGLVWRTAPDEAVKLAAEARTVSGGLGTTAWRADFLEGRVALAGGRKDAGMALLRKAVDALESTRRSLSAEEARLFRAEYAAVYEAIVEASLGGGDMRGAAVAAEQMALADHDEPPVPEDAVSADLRALTDRQVWLQRELAGASPSQATALRQQLAAVQAQFASKVDELRATYPHFAELVRTDPEDLESVRTELPVGVVVVQPVSLPTKLVLLVYRRERLAVREVPVTTEELSKQVYSVARSLRAADTWDPDWTRAQCDKLGEWLYAPIADELATATTVVVSATGVFRQLPFALLRHEGKWLVEKASVVSVTHVGSLRTVPGKAANRFKIDARGLLLVGNPDGSLPGAKAEVEAIGGLFKGATVLVGDQGKRIPVLEACAGRTLVHLATHGILDANFPDRSHIVLTGYPQPEGVLGYREIPGLGMWLDKTRLVVLSACESGLPGDLTAGRPAMAVNGLAGQFRRAGVETLIASLWSVSDVGTNALMTAFYTRLGKGDDIGRALQAAQVSLLASKDFSHPFYWAPFIVVGDWR